MIDLLKENFAALTGVVGTLLGVIVGAILNRLSRLGKLKIYFVEISNFFQEPTGSGGFKTTEELTDKTHHMGIDLKVDIINTSEFTKKILRQIKFVAVSSESTISKKFSDQSTWTSKSGIIRIDNLENINIPPREIKNLHLTLSVSEDIEQVLSSKWFFVYTDGNNKKHRKRLRIEP